MKEDKQSYTVGSDGNGEVTKNHYLY
jgi:hypothetical protein